MVVMTVEQSSKQMWHNGQLLTTFISMIGKQLQLKYNLGHFYCEVVNNAILLLFYVREVIHKTIMMLERLSIKLSWSIKQTVNKKL